MNELMARLLLLLVFFSISCNVLIAEDMKPDFVVAPNGKDTNDGSDAKPFATINRAKEEVRKLIVSGLKKNITVLIREGFYELDGPLVFGIEDSGSEKFSITYTAKAGEKPTISAGKLIKGWQKSNGNIWSVDIPDVKSGNWFFRQLFINDNRAIRASFPKVGQWLIVKSCSPDNKVLGFSDKLPGENLAGKDVELLMLHHWSVSRALVASSTDSQITSVTSIGWMGHGEMTCASPGKPIRLENARSFLTQPGEWCLERASGKLFYFAAEGTDPNKLEIVAPKYENIVVVSGTKEKPIQNIHFKGLAFKHAEFPMPSFGYSEIQAGHYSPNMSEPMKVPSVAIEFSYLVDASMKDCILAHTGSAGIGFGAGCLRNQVVGCHIFDIGSNGVMVGWRAKSKLKPDGDWADATDVPQGNKVNNNLIYDCGSFNHGGVAIAVMFTADTQIAHNEIKDLPYTGISVGFKWDSIPTSQTRCIVEHNHIYNVMNVLADGGGIYSLGLQPGTIMRGNVIHGVHRSALGGGAPNNGFFIDEGSKGFHFEDNVVYDTSGGAIRFNQNREDGHTWKNNEFTGMIKSSVKGKVGRGLACSNNAGFLELPHAPELDAPQFTIEAWVNLSVIPADADPRRWVVNKNSNEWADGHYALMVSGAKIGAYLNIGGGEKNCISVWSDADVLKPQEWYHLAMSYDGVTLKVYLNGKLNVAKEINKPRTTGSSTVAIGRRQDAFNYFPGTVDEVRIYNRVLPESEIAEHFAKPEETSKKVDDKLAAKCSFEELVKNEDRLEKIISQAGPEEPYKSALQKNNK